MNRAEFEKYTAETYSAEAETPWEGFPENVVFRHAGNRKWFALVMDVPKDRLGLHEEGLLSVVNVKCDPDMTFSLRQQSGFFPAYHMNKERWITIALDGSVDDETIKALLELSFELTDAKPKKRKG